MRQENRPDTDYILADCGPTDDVGDCVFVSGAAAFPKSKVSRASCASWSTMPVVGIIVSKPSATEAIVQVDGLVFGVFGGLQPGMRYFVDSSGQITTDLPNNGFVQVVGEALSGSILKLRIGEPVRVYDL